MNYFSFLLLVSSFSTSFLIHHAAGILEGESIVGGDVPKVGELNYMVSVQDHTMQHICGGGIIDTYFVLTAAHCFIDEHDRFIDDNTYSIVAASHYVNIKEGAVIRIGIEKVCVPRKFSRINPNPRDETFRIQADIAVAKLSRPLPIGSHPLVSKLELPKSNNHLDYLFHMAIVAGFGCEEIQIKMDEKTKQYEEVFVTPKFRLKSAATLVFSNRLCQTHSSQIIYESHICAQVIQRGKLNPEGVCAGDSGGPLVFENTVIGILSTSPYRCNETIIPAVYIRVSSFLTFINDAVKGFENPDIRCTTIKQ